MRSGFIFIGVPVWAMVSVKAERLNRVVCPMLGFCLGFHLSLKTDKSPFEHNLDYVRLCAMCIYNIDFA